MTTDSDELKPCAKCVHSGLGAINPTTMMSTWECRKEFKDPALHNRPGMIHGPAITIDYVRAMYCHGRYWTMSKGT